MNELTSTFFSISTDISQPVRPDLSEQITLFTISTILAGLIIRLAISLAHTYGILDRPGQHKQHKHLTPFVGGTGIFAALLIALCFLIGYYPEQSVKWLGLGISSAIIFIMGFADDILQLHYKTRLIVQTVAVLIMTLVSGVVLTDLGSIFPGGILALGIFAIPFTLFATIGGINALNMIDGIDGLSGSVTLMSLILLGSAALIADNQPNLIIIIALTGGTMGFLFFNLRYRLQPRARVFLGDNGSMLLGFVITWLLIDLSQGSNRAMTPVTALWLFSVPLMDTISIMLRRIWQHKSPFEPDHNHLHHILLNAGYRVSDVIFAIVSIHLLFGLIGLTGLYLGVNELTMLTGFLLFFSGYFYLSLHPWYFITALRQFHTLWGLTPTQSHGFFLGSYTPKEAENLVRMLSQELRPSMDSLVHVIKNKAPSSSDEDQYAVVVNIRLLDADVRTIKDKIENFVTSAQKRINERCGIQLRPFVEHNPRNDRRIQNQSNPSGNKRVADRRKPNQKLLVFEAMFDQTSISKRNYHQESVEPPINHSNS
ncbi:MAG TPA: MraY family glycosyltransferase [Nitrosomonas europaea]|uniref:MraY family glycosyltransferase n=1 Tax=Nitrosomonas europaea TaxID=915 RepID=UPI00248FBA49|nr:MraY family glycosyltransferase [Nitrosomonas europaea]HRO55613.1 MraY family glycosyltransferase [Nitrosomonas europaea]HUM72890.1 MraY family glycosyltransferase [Nitrosomonas europaea]